MPRRATKEVKSRVEQAQELVKQLGCVTVAALAKALDVGWGEAKYALNQLKKERKVVETAVGDRLLFCVDGDAAEEEVYKLRLETWRLICGVKYAYVYPARLACLIMEDAQARKMFTKYVPASDLLKASGLKFLDAVLRDLLGGEFDRRTHRKVYAVPPEFCRQPPPRTKLRIYKQPHTIVTFWVGEKMLQDIENAAEALGVDKSRLIHMAIEQLLEQYKHLLST